MKTPIIFFFFIALICPGILSATGKNPFQGWNDGILVTKNQEIIKGKIFYSVEHEVVQVKINNQIKTFTPYNVHYFQFYDEEREIKRLFACLDSEPKKFKTRGKGFYEVLLQGDLVLLRKEESHYIPSYEILYNTIDLVPSMASSHYILKKDKLVYVHNFQRDILPLMNDFEKEIADFIKNENLNTHDILGQILVVDHYNYLKNPEYKKLQEQFLVKE